MVTIKELIDALREENLMCNSRLTPHASRLTTIKGIAYDSREVEEGYAFVARHGIKEDSHKYVESAIKNGARFLVVEGDKKLQIANCKLQFVKVKDSRKALAVLANKFYAEPSKNLKVLGITGTYGKTTSTWLLKSIYEKAESHLSACGPVCVANATGRHAQAEMGSQLKVAPTGLIGTIEYYIGDLRIPAQARLVHYTTPESLELQKIFADMLNKGVKTVVMEVSSHALELSRVYKTDFDIAGFTTLGRDHLDFHGSIENYMEAKLKLFSELKGDGLAVLNKDSHVFEQFRNKTKARVITYGTTPECDVYGRLERATVEGTEVNIKWRGKEFNIFSPLIGGYNLSNILLASACALGDGIEPCIICDGIKELKRVPGRFEIIGRVIIDYAHTPGALESALRSAKSLCKGRLVCIFGCGGDRDAGKRQLMGKAASEFADWSILTTDNPRSEDPMGIIKDIEKGFIKPNYEVILDRKDAIYKAIKRSADEDIILLAGKGHEKSQIYGELKVPWDEREVVEELLKMQEQKI